jgi:3-hydroxyacyl-CoA dehydrogenase/enoyl-CoA hydratase/3-hydroxybutyryl-CoA epimerase
MMNYNVDSDGIATVEWDLPGRSQNVMNDDSIKAWVEAMDKAIADPAVSGILVTSAKKDFIAGGDLEMLLKMQSAGEVFEWSKRFHAACRRIETSGKPVACAMPGSALGGGLEIAMVCHYRVASDNPKARFGLPEATLGLLPGGGGTQRLPRLIGYAAAIPMMTEGRKIKSDAALKQGILHAVVPAGTERDAARAWLRSDAGKTAKQPWDTKGSKIPGGGLATPNGMMFFTAANAMLRDKTYGNYPAQKHILSCVYEGLATDIDTGLKIEGRYFAACVTSPEAKNMIRSLFFGIQEANKLATRPAGVPVQKYSRIGMLGAGMMGAGIAMATSTAGIEVVLLDTTQAAADKGKAYAIKQWAKMVEKGRMKAEDADALAARIHPTADFADLKGCEIVVEAVFESRQIKADVTQKTEAVIVADAIFASNTSTLPITGLAEASSRPANFIGLHFFSPAEKMPLVEIIIGAKTSDETLARSMDYVKAIGKTPIVVNDSRGFYTSRVFGTYVREGMALLEEGVSPVLIDKAGLISGMPVGPLALADEVSIELVYKIASETRTELGGAYVEGADYRVGSKMVAELGRLGKKIGKGFYDYPEGGQKHIWPELARHFPQKPESEQPSVEQIRERLIMVQSIDTVRCLEEKVLRAPIDADVGAILGWGFPPFRGGPLGWLHTIGLKQAVADCERLAAAHGPRFAAPKLLLDLAERGEDFFPV